MKINNVSAFFSKKLNGRTTLGERFQKARRDFGIDLKTAATAVRIPEKYLSALEKNRFQDLPGAKVYRQNYVRQYAKFLHLDENETSKQFAQEKGFKNLETIHPKKPKRNAPLFSFSIFARNLLVVGLILLFTGYLGWQVKRVIEPPDLVIYNPAEGITVENHDIVIQGETEKECHVAINGQEITPDEKGRFNLSMNLSEGLNTIVVTATKKHGKTSSVTRHIVVKTSALSLKSN